MVGSEGYIRTLIHVPSSVLRDYSSQSSIGYLSYSDSSALKPTTEYTYSVGLVSLLHYLIDLTCLRSLAGAIYQAVHYERTLGVTINITTTKEDTQVSALQLRLS